MKKPVIKVKPIFIEKIWGREINNKKIDLNSEKINLNQDSKNSANQKIIELQNKINEERINNPNSKKIKYYENMLDILSMSDYFIATKEFSMSYYIDYAYNFGAKVLFSLDEPLFGGW